ncbi:MAG: GxxExxY protein [bacterium]|nr:GxxExxY protein [bacterium]
MSYEREKILSPTFVGEKIGRNKVDFLIENKILIEVKAKRIISKEDYYQTRRYLSSLNIKLGILVNFRSDYIHPKRILNSSAQE